MISPANIAEAKRLDARAVELWRRASTLTQAEYRAAGLSQYEMPKDACCEAGLPLRAEATALRARAKALRLGTDVPSPQSKDPSMSTSRREAIQKIADSFTSTGFRLPSAMIDRAIASAQSVESFAIEASHHVAARRTETERSNREDQLVAEIAAFIPGSAAPRSDRPAGELTNPTPDPASAPVAAEDLAAEIAAFLPTDRRRPAR